MKTHQKMCWNCDGHVHVYELKCPYCGADLTEVEQQTEDPVDELPDFEETQEEAHHEMNFEKELEHPPFQELMEEVDQPVTHEEWDQIPEEKEEDLDNPLASLLLLLPGTLFFLFGLALFLFSQNGVLIFQFSARYWFVYLLGSCLPLYLGWRSLFPAKPLTRDLPEEEEELETSQE